MALKRKTARKVARKPRRKVARKPRRTVVYRMAKAAPVRAVRRRRVVKRVPVRRRRRINGVINGMNMNGKGIMGALMSGAQVHIGDVGGQVLASKVPGDINPNIKAAGMVLLGAVFHKKAPRMAEGFMSAGMGLVTGPILRENGIITGVINALDPYDVDMIEDAASGGGDY